MKTSWPIWRSLIVDHPVEWMPSSPVASILAAAIFN
jgi:hypothetical protein